MAKKTTAPKSDASKASAKKASTKSSTKAEPKKGFPKKAGGDGKPGVIGSIVEFLQHATAKKPITKKELLAKLLERFPDRESKAMQRTINCQIPTRLATDKELIVNKAATDNGNGYWI